MSSQTSNPDLRVEKLDAVLGARIEGIDVREPLTPDLVERLRELLFEHQVLFFRDQPLSDAQHIQFASHFGVPNVYPITKMLGSDKPLEFVWDGPDRKPAAAGWHTDVTWLQDPPKIGVLNAQVMPKHGGDTLWCSLYTLYDALSPDERAVLRDLVVHNAPGRGFIERVVQSIDDALVEPFRDLYGGGAQHPLVSEHYVTGRPLLYLCGGFMDHVVGKDPSEGRALLKRLMERADDPANQIRWEWAVNDLAIWDERSTMHRVDASHWPEVRRMRRCTVS
jgi:taurine dioxygenase